MSKKKEFGAGMPMEYTFDSKGVDVDAMISDALEGVDVEMIRLTMTPGEGEKEHYVFYLQGETTQGVELILRKRNKGVVVVPGFSSLHDVAFAFGLLKSAGGKTGMDSITFGRGRMVSLREAEDETWQECRENYLAAIREEEVYLVIEGILGSYRLLGRFLKQKYPGSSDEELMKRAIDDFKKITSLIGNGDEFGAASVSSPNIDNGEEYEARYVFNREGWGTMADRFILVDQKETHKVIKIVDCHAFQEATMDNPYINWLDPATFSIKGMPAEEWTILCDSMDGEIVNQPKTYLLRWNPAISSFKAEYHDDAIEKYGGDWGMDWSVYEWQEAKEGDIFYMLREGDGVAPGIYYRGYFSSDPYVDDDWRGSDHKRHYVDIECHDGRPMSEGAWITTDELEAAIPGINWRKGHSGELMTAEQATILDRLWNEKVKPEA